ncbi:MAG: hypothetical protein DI566_03535 [Microbacterium sp.]|nr:MAG: hypothetical protein DI566_03535 [Microbacterium sp.]
MSFGPAAQRPHALPGDAPCPCGGGRFAECCGPLLGGVPADAPEALMRSRYTAFAVGDTVYLLATWHPSTAPERIDLDPAQRWDRLEIVDSSLDGRRGSVEFRAHWSAGADGGVLHEVSRFRLAAGRWYYLDGDVDAIRTF